MNSMAKGFFKAIIILVVLFSVIYYFGYQRWLEKEFTDDDYSKYLENLPEEKEDINNNQTVEDSIDQSEAKSLYEMVNFEMVQENYGEEFFNIYYDSEYTDSFSDEYIVYLGIINLYKNDFINNCYGTFEVSVNDVDNKIKEIFGNDIEYINTSFSNKDKTLEIQYDNEKDMYVVTNYRCSGIEFGKGHIVTEFIEGKLDSGYLEIVEYVYYMDYQKEENGRYVLNFYDSLNNSGNIISEEVLSDSDKEKMPIYKLIFKEEAGNYIFKDIKRIK